MISVSLPFLTGILLAALRTIGENIEFINQRSLNLPLFSEQVPDNI